ncbi:MAG: hypothetical protein ABL958_21130, partial [Bdellovibrionia bacterium]
MTSLKVWTYAYEFPALTSGDDADWQRNQFMFRAGSFRAEFDEVCFEGRLIRKIVEELEEFS